MRVALALVVALVVALGAMTAPAMADEAGVPPQPAAPPPAQTPQAPVPAPTPQGPSATEPAVDPAYGERPDAHESAERMGPNERAGVRRRRDIVVKYRADRSRQNITTVALLGGAGLLFGGVGLYFHFDSRSATDEVKSHRYTGRTWTPERQDTFDRAHRSAALAGVGYGIGGAFLIATAVVYMATEPPLEELVIHPHTDEGPVTMVTPLPGGAFVSRGWEF
jgi:hypothetical protein